MMFFNDSIIPYVGTDTFKLGDKIENIRSFLKENHIGFDQSIDSNKGCEPEIPWTFIRLSDSITLCFVLDILFEIVLENDYKGKLTNGGYIGMKVSEIKDIDSSLEYNDEDEDFVSSKGYWITDSVDTGNVESITIFLPDVERDDFFKYDWIANYK